MYGFTVVWQSYAAGGDVLKLAFDTQVRWQSWAGLPAKLGAPCAAALCRAGPLLTAHTPRRGRSKLRSGAPRSQMPSSARQPASPGTPGCLGRGATGAIGAGTAGSALPPTNACTPLPACRSRTDSNLSDTSAAGSAREEVAAAAAAGASRRVTYEST